MARKYVFVIADNVPADVKKRIPEFVEAGPATIKNVLDGVSAKLGDGYNVTEDPDDYQIFVTRRRAA